MLRKWGIAGCTLFTLVPALAAGTINWSVVPVTTIQLFYPGAASWESLLHHEGGVAMRAGRSCRDCHAGEEARLGQALLQGEAAAAAREQPRAVVPLQVQTAYDADALYVRLRWPPAPRPDAGREAGDYERISVMLSDGSVHGTKAAGCWIACHDDEKGMPSDTAAASMTAYVPSSRERMTDRGGDGYYRAPDALRALLAAGKFLEYWQVLLSGTGAPQVEDGYILERSHVNRSPQVQAAADRAGGDWDLILRRPLNADGVHKPLQPGRRYWLGFALHDEGLRARYHDVSFAYTLQLGGEGDADLHARRIE